MNTIYTIELAPQGVDKMNPALVAVNKVGEAVNSINTAINPLAKIIQLLENTNKILLSIGKVGVSSFNKLDDILSETREGFSKGTSQAEKLENKINSIGKAGEKAGEKVEKGLLSKFANFGQAFVGIKAAAQSLVSPIMSVFEEGMSRQNAVSDFETLLYGDKEAAKKLAEDIRQTDAATLYGTDTMNEAVKQMIGYGVDTETSFQMSEALGDIAMGDKNKMGSLSMAFSQMAGLGKLQTQDWKQMVGAGFNPFSQMEKDLGKSKDELQEMMEKGKITSDMVKDAFMHATQTKYFDIEGKVHYAADEEQLKKAKADFEKANEEIAKKGGKKKEWQEDKGQYWQATTGTLEGTLSGKLAKLQSKFSDLKAKLFEALMPVAEKLIDLVSNKVFPMIEKAWPIIDAIGAGIGYLTDLIIENWDAISDLAIGIGSVVGAIMLLTSPMTWTIVAVSALTAGIIWLYKNWEEWHDVVVAICYPLAVVIDIIKSVKKHWDSIVDGFKNGGLLEGIKRLGLAILDGILTPVESLLKMLSKIPVVGKGISLLADGVSSLREKIQSSIPEVVKVETENKPEDNGTQSDLENAVNQSTKGGTGLGGGSATAKGTEKVASGGTRNTQITITLGNLVGTMAFSGGFEENREQVESNITDSLLRLLYSAAYAVE